VKKHKKEVSINRLLGIFGEYVREGSLFEPKANTKAREMGE